MIGIRFSITRAQLMLNQYYGVSSLRLNIAKAPSTKIEKEKKKKDRAE